MPLDTKYDPSDLRILLGLSLVKVCERETLGGARQASYYEGHAAIVFPPSTDNPNYAQLETIEETLTHAFEHCPNLLNTTLASGKKMIFPIAETQPLIQFWGLNIFPRNHWVTLHYDPASRIATVVDSRPQSAGVMYSLEPMKALLTLGLSRFVPTTISIQNRYQHVQEDDIHCGAWTAINIEAFAHGVTLEHQQNALSVKDKDGVIQHNIALTKGAPIDAYTPINHQKMSISSIDTNNSVVLEKNLTVSKPLKNNDHTDNNLTESRPRLQSKPSLQLSKRRGLSFWSSHTRASSQRPPLQASFISIDALQADISEFNPLINVPT